MCEFEQQLVAWLDHELPQNEAAEIERHVKGCAGCSKLGALYTRTSSEFMAYCDAVTAVDVPRKAHWTKSVAQATAAIAACVALAILALHSHERAKRPQAQIAPPENVTAPRVPVETMPVSGAPEASPRKRKVLARTQRRSLAAPSPAQQASLIPPGPALQVTIPADAVLPPGAAPAGTSFVVDFSVAPDGSAQGIRVRPELAGFERRATQP